MSDIVFIGKLTFTDVQNIFEKNLTLIVSIGRTWTCSKYFHEIWLGESCCHCLWPPLLSGCKEKLWTETNFVSKALRHDLWPFICNSKMEPKFSKFIFRNLPQSSLILLTLASLYRKLVQCISPYFNSFFSHLIPHRFGRFTKKSPEFKCLNPPTLMSPSVTSKECHSTHLTNCQKKNPFDEN